jgi:ornithine carbamoyltransferase
MEHFLSLSDLTKNEFDDLMSLARQLKDELQQKGQNDPVLAGKTLAMIFQKPSLRTRVSFEIGMLQLGGHALYLSPNEIQLGKRESVADVARVVSRYANAIMARVFAHDHVVELAQHSRVPVINGLSDYNHPCQGLADYLTLLEAWGSFDGRTLAYVGDGNNVLTSLINGAAHAGVKIRAATPEGHEPPTSVVDQARQRGVDITVLRNPVEAVEGADAVYTDVWTSMGQETEASERQRLFPPYQVNQRLLSHASPEVVVLHCLPAHRGEEITDEVADGPHSRLWDQAENRLHAQKALLVRLLV